MTIITSELTDLIICGDRLADTIRFQVEKTYDDDTDFTEGWFWFLYYEKASDGSGDPWNKYDIEEVRTYVANNPDMIVDEIFESLESLARTKRDLLLTKLDTIVSNPIRYQTFSEETIVALTIYRQKLLDLPDQEKFPNQIVWPVIPSLT